MWYETDFIAAFELRRSNAVAKVKWINYKFGNACLKLLFQTGIINFPN